MKLKSTILCLFLVLFSNFARAVDQELLKNGFNVLNKPEIVLCADGTECLYQPLLRDIAKSALLQIKFIRDHQRRCGDGKGGYAKGLKYFDGKNLDPQFFYGPYDCDKSKTTDLSTIYIANEFSYRIENKDSNLKSNGYTDLSQKGKITTITTQAAVTKMHELLEKICPNTLTELKKEVEDKQTGSLSDCDGADKNWGMEIKNSCSGSGSKVASKVPFIKKIQSIISSSDSCESRIAGVNKFLNEVKVTHIDDKVILDYIKKYPSLVLNNPKKLELLYAVTQRHVAKSVHCDSFCGGNMNLQKSAIILSNALIGTENEVLKEKVADCEKVAKITEQFKSLIDDPENSEKKARQFAIECDTKVAKLFGDEGSMCTVSGYGITVDTKGKRIDRNSAQDYFAGAYDSGSDGRWHCYADDKISSDTTKNFYAPPGFTNGSLGYGSSCGVGSGVCNKGFDSPACKKGRQKCQDGRILNYNKLGCHKSPIIFNPSHIYGTTAPLSGRPVNSNKSVSIGNWGGLGGEGEHMHIHSQFTIGGGKLVDPVNMFCRPVDGECF